jgi:hypothetical protein
VAHHDTLLLAFAGAAMVLSPAATERRFRSRHGDMFWPWGGQRFEAVNTVTLAACVPLRLSAHVALLALRYALFLLGNFTLLPVWPRTAHLSHGLALNSAVLAACIAALAVADKRAWARWRARRAAHARAKGGKAE